MHDYTVTMWLSDKKPCTLTVQAVHHHDAIGRALGAIEPGEEIRSIVFDKVDGKERSAPVCDTCAYLGRVDPLAGMTVNDCDPPDCGGTGFAPRGEE